jgi:hypothetical protein
MTSNRSKAWNAVKAVGIVFVSSFVLAVAAYYFMHGMDPCHAVNTQILASPDGAFSARKVEVSCKIPKGTTHQVQIAIAERNNKTGKPKQFANVFSCYGLTASDVSISWEAQRQLAVLFPQATVESKDISAQQPKFKDVEIEYGNKAATPVQ